MTNCIFCKIAQHEMNAHVVYEDDFVVAFLDIQPRAPGHTMVIPKNHVVNLSELPDSQIESFFSAVKKVTDIVRSALTPDGFTLGMNYGEASGQEVQHMHFHIMPRWAHDGGGPIQRVVMNTPEEDVATLAEKIRTAK
jgi:histidine triad (HIT) family protein